MLPVITSSAVILNEAVIVAPAVTMTNRAVILNEVKDPCICTCRCLFFASPSRQINTVSQGES